MIYKLKCNFCNEDFCCKKKHQKFCSISCGLKNHTKIYDPSFVKDGWSVNTAYIAGLIWSDGCLSLNKDGSYRITISNTDYDLLTKLHALIAPERKLYSQIIKDKYYYSIITTNIEVVDFYILAGLTERKSKSLSIPELPTEYLPNFICGYFDGDGSIFYTKKDSTKYLGLRFTCGDKDFLEWLKTTLSTYNISMSLTKDSRKNTWYLSTYNKQTITNFALLIYKNTDIYMERKYRFFQDSDMV